MSFSRFIPLHAFFALAISVHAAEPPTNIVLLDPFVVRSERDTRLTLPSFTATAAELQLIPGGVEVVSAERFLRGRASTVADTLALSPGVIAQSRFGSDEARLSIRGSGLQRTFHGRGLRVLQDDVPINLADGSFDMQTLEPLATDHIAIWRGANALAYGASTLGGAINFVSSYGSEATPTSLRLELGSWDYVRAHLADRTARGPADAYASLTHHSQQSFRAHAVQDNQRLFANAGWRFSPRAETRLFLAAVNSESELPGNLTRAQLETDPRQAATGNLTLDQQRNFDLLRIASKTTALIGDSTWETIAAWTYKDLDHPIFQVIDQCSNDVLLGTRFTRQTDVAGYAHRLCAGLLLTRGEIRAANFVNQNGQRGALVSSAVQTATNLEAYAEDQIALGRGVTLVLGLAAALNRRDNDQCFGTTPDYAFDHHRILPKLGVRWDLRDLQLYANVSASYEPPSFNETLTLATSRDAQAATSLELGARGHRGPVSWDITVYHAALKRELLFLDHDNNAATAPATVNADDTTHSGLEFATEIDLLGTAWDSTNLPSHRLVLRSAWTYGRFKFDRDPLYADNTLAGLPPHLIRTELAWEHRSGWYVGPTIEWVPQKTFIDFRNTYAADAYTLYGFRLGRRPPAGLGWFAEGRNLADETYATTTGVIENAAGTDQPQFLPGDGRSVYFGIEYSF